MHRFIYSRDSLVNLSKRNRLHPVLLSNPDQLGGPIVQVRELVLLDAVTGRLTASVRRKPAVLVIRKHRRLAELGQFFGKAIELRKHGRMTDAKSAEVAPRPTQLVAVVSQGRTGSRNTGTETPRLDRAIG